MDRPDQAYEELLALAHSDLEASRAAEALFKLKQLNPELGWAETQARFCETLMGGEG